MKCCDLTPGQLRVRVWLQAKVRVPDGAGGSVDEWVTVRRPYTKWRHASMGERLRAMAVQAGAMHTVWMRYVTGVAPDMRIVDSDGTTYNIRGVVDIEKRRRWLELAVEEGVAAGEPPGPMVG